jgi:hypothetical protein
MEPGMKRCTGAWLLAFGDAPVVNQQALSADDPTDANTVTVTGRSQ